MYTVCKQGVEVLKLVEQAPSSPRLTSSGRVSPFQGPACQTALHKSTRMRPPECVRRCSLTASLTLRGLMRVTCAILSENQTHLKRKEEPFLTDTPARLRVHSTTIKSKPGKSQERTPCEVANVDQPDPVDTHGINL
jgi:hypothetical protein